MGHAHVITMLSAGDAGGSGSGRPGEAARCRQHLHVQDPQEAAATPVAEYTLLCEAQPGHMNSPSQSFHVTLRGDFPQCLF